MKADIYFSEQFDSMSSKKENYIISSKKRSIPLTEGMSLYYALQKEGIVLTAPCAGKGTCGACKVKLLRGELPVTDKDTVHLSKAECEEGWRLSCQAYPSEDCAVFIPQENFCAVSAYGEKLMTEGTGLETNATRADSLNHQGLTGKVSVNDRELRYKIAIDLGTTTIVYELFDDKTGETVRTYSATNSQRLYGADVVSRMDQSDNGRKEMLKNILRKQMRGDIRALIGETEAEKILSINISANTAMVHLFMGYSCEGLGKYPFMPHTLDCIRSDARMLNLMDREIPVFITGGISAYVGGDILAGLGLQRFLSEKKVSLFIDLGTNAEMALSDGNGKIYVTSAPAGPAFEAANISCGVGSVEGAISSICIEKGRLKWATIGGKNPVGFCGSGILEALFELLKNHIIDESGLLQDEYFEMGYPVRILKITQQDIRQIQLAKSAVISAISILVQKAGVTLEQVEEIYLAGGFGYHLNVEKAIGIGLIPKEFSGKVKAVGNTSLQGTKEMALGRVAEKDLSKIKEACEEVYLSNETDFQDVFMENMNF